MLYGPWCLRPDTYNLYDIKYKRNTDWILGDTISSHFMPPRSCVGVKFKAPGVKITGETKLPISKLWRLDVINFGKVFRCCNFSGSFRFSIFSACRVKSFAFSAFMVSSLALWIFKILWKISQIIIGVNQESHSFNNNLNCRMFFDVPLKNPFISENSVALRTTIDLSPMFLLVQIEVFFRICLPITSLT